MDFETVMNIALSPTFTAEFFILIYVLFPLVLCFVMHFRFVVYKRPGLSYVYQSSDSQQDATANTSWIESSKTIDATDSIVALTLEPLYQFNSIVVRQLCLFSKNPIIKRSVPYCICFLLLPLLDQTDRLVLMYNDEWPNGTSSETAAHAKGVVAFDVATSGSGFWLIHSVPRFPPSPAPDSSYSFPPTGERYGQTMLCISLPSSQADIIGNDNRGVTFLVYSNHDPFIRCSVIF